MSQKSKLTRPQLDQLKMAYKRGETGRYRLTLYGNSSHMGEIFVERGLAEYVYQREDIERARLASIIDDHIKAAQKSLADGNWKEALRHLHDAASLDRDRVYKMLVLTEEGKKLAESL